MTTFRFEAGAGVCLLLALTACGNDDQPATLPIPEIVNSQLQGGALRDAFTARLLHLADDDAAFEREMAAAGFRLHSFPARRCGRWEYPVGADARALRAFVQYCRESGVTALRRFGIARRPMSYD